MQERLQKIMAGRGVASRRAAEKIILEGRVQVNGQVIGNLGAKADPELDEIAVDGKILPKQMNDFTYILLYKPAGYICSVTDPRGRRTIMDLLPEGERLYPVGRLDYATSGLLIVTNDGAMTNGLLHPKGEVPKAYECAVKGQVDKEQISKLCRGIKLSDGMTAPAKAAILKEQAGNTVVKITIHEGRNRQVRRMMEVLGLEVVWLSRKGFAGMDLTGLKPGEWRYLTGAEVENLRCKAGL
ncbi:MAG: pseudouridine synthase [Clostridia bacterium]|nr:pseudouridine synthase [Clostridia bacterium]MDD4571534.1 pseudouridine synthase [Clostridia bacterium]